MELFTFDLSWMSLNVFLAIIPVILGWLLYQTRRTSLKILYGLVWFLFIPNTLYLLFDITHFFEDFPVVALQYKPLIIFVYALLATIGIMTYIWGMYPFEKTVRQYLRHHHHQLVTLCILMVNALIGIAVVIGRFERTNSWDVVLHPAKVLADIHTATNSLLQVELAIFFFALSTGIYWLGKREVKKLVERCSIPKQSRS